jgi:hypothetical protein
MEIGLSWMAEHVIFPTAVRPGILLHIDEATGVGDAASVGAVLAQSC